MLEVVRCCWVRFSLLLVVAVEFGVVVLFMGVLGNLLVIDVGVV